MQEDVVNAFENFSSPTVAYWIQGDYSRCTKYNSRFTSNSMQSLSLRSNDPILWRDWWEFCPRDLLTEHRIGQRDWKGRVRQQISFTWWSSTCTYIIHSLPKKNIFGCSHRKKCFSLNFPKGLGTNLLLGATGRNLITTLIPLKSA